MGQPLEGRRQEALRLQSLDGGHPLAGDGGQARTGLHSRPGTGQGAPKTAGAGPCTSQDKPLPDEA